MESTNRKLEVKESSTPGDSGKGQEELLCLEAPQGATGQNPVSENIDGLTENVGTLGL
jgi:hypothetical protein